MQLEEVKKNLEKRGFQARVFATGKEAADYLVAALAGKTVGIGGSMTVIEMGLLEALKGKCEYWCHGDKEQLEKYGSEYIRNQASATEAYVSSVNGMSEQGQLINVDGRGNRLASTLYGHKKVYYVVGKNKLAPDFEGAMWRARNVAGPKNAQRLKMKTPCAIKGDKCYDCASPDRICRGFLISELPTYGQEVEVLLIDENLGY